MTHELPAHAFHGRFVDHIHAHLDTLFRCDRPGEVRRILHEAFEHWLPCYFVSVQSLSVWREAVTHIAFMSSSLIAFPSLVSTTPGLRAIKSMPSDLPSAALYLDTTVFNAALEIEYGADMARE